MRATKYAIMALLLGPFAAQPNAQTVQGNIGGSMPFGSEAGRAAFSLDGTASTCDWTSSPTTLGSTYVLDQRAPDVPQYFQFSRIRRLALRSRHWHP
jgi:hypothetical protein